MARLVCALLHAPALVAAPELAVRLAAAMAMGRVATAAGCPPLTWQPTCARIGRWRADSAGHAALGGLGGRVQDAAATAMCDVGVAVKEELLATKDRTADIPSGQSFVVRGRRRMIDVVIERTTASSEERRAYLTKTSSKPEACRWLQL